MVTVQQHTSREVKGNYAFFKLELSRLQITKLFFCIAIWCGEAFYKLNPLTPRVTPWVIKRVSTLDSRTLQSYFALNLVLFVCLFFLSPVL